MHGRLFPCLILMFLMSVYRQWVCTSAVQNWLQGNKHNELMVWEEALTLNVVILNLNLQILLILPSCPTADYTHYQRLRNKTRSPALISEGISLPRYWENHQRGRESSLFLLPGWRLVLSHGAMMGSLGGEEWHPLKLHHFVEHAHRLCDISQVSAYNKGLAFSERPTWCLWPLAIGLGISLKTSPPWSQQKFSRALQWKWFGVDEVFSASVSSSQRKNRKK